MFKKHVCSVAWRAKMAEIFILSSVVLMGIVRGMVGD